MIEAVQSKEFVAHWMSTRKSPRASKASFGEPHGSLILPSPDPQLAATSEEGERQVPLQSFGTAGTCLGGGNLRKHIHCREHSGRDRMEQSRRCCSSAPDFP